MVNEIAVGNATDILAKIPDRTVDCCVTSPPYYGLRNYGVDGQIGLENTPEEYVNSLVTIFREVRRVLKDDGTLWLNIGDSYAGKKIRDIKRKELIGIPWLAAFALRNDGWYLRQDIIWNKTNAMPESVKDRCTKSHEYIFLLSKSEKYYFDSESILEEAKYDGRKDTYNKGSLKYSKSDILPKGTPQSMTMAGRAHERWRFKDGVAVKNKRDIWSVPTKAYKGAHFATFPEKLIEPCILAGSRPGGIVLDPFIGSGTTAVVAKKNGRNYIGIDLNSEYAELAEKRLIECGG